MERVCRVVMFCDISGFMRLATVLGDRMPGFVQEFYEMVGDAVVGLGGRLVKYIGDSVLSVFSSGREIEAVRCAQRMQGGFLELLGRHAPGADARLEAAISSGEVTEGVYGHGSLRLFDVMGEPVAHASVLSRFPGIKVTAKVRDAVGGELRMEERPPVPLKWGGDPLRVWIVSERCGFTGKAAS
jgi:class 3 adenylate cyclase